MIPLLITFLLCGTAITRDVVSALVFVAKVVPALPTSAEPPRERPVEKLAEPVVKLAEPERPKRLRMRFRGSDSGIVVTASNGDEWWAAMPNGPWHYQGTGTPRGADATTWDQWLAHKRTTVRDVWAARLNVEITVPETKS